MQPINLQEQDFKSLKALVYDFLVAKEDAERNIQIVNQEISIRIKAEMDKPKQEENFIPASNHNSLVNSTEGNQLIT